MAATYFLAGILIILFNITDVPAAILTIVQSAFGLKAAAGGALGAMVVAMQKGIARGIFSNEAVLVVHLLPLPLPVPMNLYVRVLYL